MREQLDFKKIQLQDIELKVPMKNLNYSIDNANQSPPRPITKIGSDYTTKNKIINIGNAAGSDDFGYTPHVLPPVG